MKAVVAVVVGNWLEFYDFLVFTFFAVMIGDAFFPGESEIVRLLGALATFGVGFVTRPLGAAIIGPYADRVGRRAALTLTLLLMSFGSGMVALTPPYSQIGIAAPILLLIARLIQGFSCGGEVGPATTYLLESAPPEKRAAPYRVAGLQSAARVDHGRGLWRHPRRHAHTRTALRVGMARSVSARRGDRPCRVVHPPPAARDDRGEPDPSLDRRGAAGAVAPSHARRHPRRVDHLRRNGIDLRPQLHDDVRDHDAPSLGSCWQRTWRREQRGADRRLSRWVSGWIAMAASACWCCRARCTC
jgi:hypothetical protein